MKVTYDLHEFSRRVGLIRDAQRLLAVGLECESFRGTFWPEEMDDVLDFCTQNPAYHIVSFMGDGIYFNRYDKGGYIFRVADGDNDPDYMLNCDKCVNGVLATIFNMMAR